jgi:hypothetical protein
MQRAPLAATGAAVSLALATLLRVTAAHAEQFVLTDVSYTHSTATTTDSHYRVAPLPGTPSNWVSPIDYTKGSAFVRVEVKTKPSGNAPTRFQICFEGTPSYACTNQSMTYTGVGPQEWVTPFSDFYIGNGVKLDWSKGVGKVALILKDDKNGKPAPENVDAGIVKLYMPTDLHVVVGIVSEGATFKLPPDAGAPVDAGASDAGKADAGNADSGGQPAQDAAVDATPPQDAGAARDAAPAPDAAADASGRDASAPADPAEPPPEGGTPFDGLDGDHSGCQLSLGANHTGGALGGLVTLALLLVRRRNRARRSL